MIIAAIILGLIIIMYFVFITPRVFKRAEMKELRIGYAHRGAHGNGVPENSLAAFKLSVERGEGIELDIQLSKDKTVMVFHDDNLKRVCDVDAKVSDFTADELQKMKLLGTSETIPTFAEVLKTVDGRVPLLVEFKPGDYELCRLGCDMLDDYKGKFCTESFDPFMVQRIGKYRPNFIRGQLVCNMGKAKSPKSPMLRFMLTMLMGNFLTKPDFIAADHKHIHNPSVAICRCIFRTPTFLWTVKGDEMYLKYKKQGLFPIYENVNIK